MFNVKASGQVAGKLFTHSFMYNTTSPLSLGLKSLWPYLKVFEANYSAMLSAVNLMHA